MNKHRYAFPSLFLALNEVWTGFRFGEWLGIIQALDHHLDGIVAWVFYTGQYLGIDGFHAALDANFLSVETKDLLKTRLKKGTPQPRNSHLEELSSWGINFDHLHQKMVQSGGPPIPENHDYYGYFSNREE